MSGRIVLVAGAAVSITMTAGMARAQVSDSAQHGDTTLHVKGLKNPQLAEALGIFPGGGMFYAGRWREGLRGYFGTVSAIGAGGMTIAIGELRGCRALLFDTTCHPHGSVWPTRVVGSAMILSGLGFWGYEAVHAGRIVRRDNARKIAAAQHVSLGSVRPIVMPAPGDRAVNVGVRASW